MIDLHCHCVPAIDDGVRTIVEGRELLSSLCELGFTRVVATPHMRPGLFDNSARDIRQAYEQSRDELARGNELQLELSCEHYFDEIVLDRVLQGEALPYPGERAILLEFYEVDFPPHVDHTLAMLKRRGLLPVIAHPERYRAIRRDPGVLERLLDTGAVALLDVAALVGKYGRAAKRCAEALLARDLYHAACTDCHRPADVALVAGALDWITQQYGADEIEALFKAGPTEVLNGRVLS